MAAKPSTLLILISLLLSYTIVISSLSTTTNSSKPISPSKSPPSSPSPSPPPSLIPPTKSPSPKLISPTKSPSPILISPTKSPSIPPPTLSSAPLDPKQLTALQSLNIPLSKNPCSQPSIHNATLCNSDKPFSHLISLRLLNCSDEVQISSTALRSLSTLQDFQFINCPIPPIRFPPDLISNLRSFTCIKSLKKLSGVYLGKLRNLTDLTVTDVPIKASGPVIIIGTMKKLKTVKISHTNLTGFLPKKWNLNITHLDLSNNLLKGKVPTSLTLLADLQFLNLSSNTLSGELPESFGDLISLQNVSLSSNKLSGQIPDSISEIPSLVHLDLSSNQFNGTIPKFINRMKNLKYLNLESNNFHGVMPFNESFIKKFEVFKIGGNSNLCFNHSIVSKKLKLGIAQCDKDGLPVPPPPDKSSDSGFGDGSDSSDDTVDDDNDDGSNQKDNHSHGPNKVVLGVAIGLSSLIFVIVFLVLLSKRCG